MNTMDIPALSGIFPAIPTLFQENGDVDYEHLRSNLDLLNSMPLDGYVIGGSNGEFVYLTPEERVRVVAIAREILPEDRLLIAGAGMESTRATIEMTHKMALAGAQAVLLVTPGYFKASMTSEALEYHYRQIADASPVPILLYSVPANTGINLPVEAIIRLAPHPKIIGMKDSGGDITRIGLLVKETPEDFSLLAGSAGFLLGALAVGAVGCIAALANIAAHEMTKILAYFREGKMEEARVIQLRLIASNYAVTSRFGVAGLKAALDMLGFYGGPVRSPLLPIDEEKKRELAEILREADLLR
jgi:4-hydroxy-2-oxoglutarate aldolase